MNNHYRKAWLRQRPEAVGIAPKRRWCRLCRGGVSGLCRRLLAVGVAPPVYADVGPGQIAVGVGFLKAVSVGIFFENVQFLYYFFEIFISSKFVFSLIFFCFFEYLVALGTFL
jgi:hypothetical protein